MFNFIATECTNGTETTEQDTLLTRQPNEQLTLQVPVVISLEVASFAHMYTTATGVVHALALVLIRDISTHVYVYARTQKW